MLNGGGLNCVLATAYQPKSDTTEKQVKTTPKDEFKHQFYNPHSALQIVVQKATKQYLFN